MIPGGNSLSSTYTSDMGGEETQEGTILETYDTENTPAHPGALEAANAKISSRLPGRSLEQ